FVCVYCMCMFFFFFFFFSSRRRHTRFKCDWSSDVCSSDLSSSARFFRKPGKPGQARLIAPYSKFSIFIHLFGPYHARRCFRPHTSGGVLMSRSARFALKLFAVILAFSTTGAFFALPSANASLPPTFLATPSSLAYPDTGVGQTSAGKTITVHNVDTSWHLFAA